MKSRCLSLLLVLVSTLLCLPALAIEVDSQKNREAAPEFVVTVSQRILDGYVGSYRISEGFAVKVWREGDQLWVQATGQSAWPLLAVSETLFRVQDMDARISFGLNGAGVTDHLVLSMDGRETKAIRE